MGEFTLSFLTELDKTRATRYEHPDAFLEHEGSEYFGPQECTPMLTCPQFRRNCQTLTKAGFNSSGVYTIYPDGRCDGLQVYCDTETDGGDGSSFRGDKMAVWTSTLTGPSTSLALAICPGKWELRVDLEDWNGSTAWAKYGDFKISGDNFTLHIDQYDDSSTAGNAMRYHDGWPFTTKDNDNDGRSGRNCANDRDGAWWFDDCDVAHLNGVYVPGGNTGTKVDGILWDKWRGESHSLKACSMKMRLVIKP
ncbi:microfibril-associated glycoprotein 4-like [Patiria miniata]|uniref:Fibrinogen C-terminal domain-containing protein n=1 Tax=Patiria miniata TaxID=46514 RepID=A0A914AMM0_PATMI|nr:microfibril-associated glycoprotein 4-like [Patiria miniata]